MGQLSYWEQKTRSAWPLRSFEFEPHIPRPGKATGYPRPGTGPLWVLSAGSNCWGCQLGPCRATMELLLHLLGWLRENLDRKPGLKSAILRSKIHDFSMIQFGEISCFEKCNRWRFQDPKHQEKTIVQNVLGLILWWKGRVVLDSQPPAAYSLTWTKLGGCLPSLQ